MVMFVPLASAAADPTIGTVPPTDPTYFCAPRLTDLVSVIDYCRAKEGVGPLTLPDNFSALSPQEQMLVLFSLERVNRGETPVVALSSSMNGYAQQGAAINDDPPFPSGLGDGGGGIWEATTSTLWADDAFIYTDDCTATNVTNCWGHRDIILDDSNTTEPLVGGGGYSYKNLDNTWNSYTFEFSYGYPTQDYVFTWADELAHFAAPPNVEPLQAPTVTSVQPSVVSSAGGQTITVTGTDLISTTRVTLNGVAASHVNCSSETRCTAQLPAQRPGVASVQVTAAGGTSPTENVSQITYASPQLMREGTAAASTRMGLTFPHPLVVAVMLGATRAAGVPVTFTVTTANATFANGRTKATVTSASTGLAISPQLQAGRHTGVVHAVASTPSGANVIAWRLLITK